MYASVFNITLSFAFALVLHEMGHFLAARACRVQVTQAGLGWGPKVFGFRIKGVDYQLRLLPLGAYIRMDMAGLQKRPLFQQLLVLLAGIAVNLILAVRNLGKFLWHSEFGAGGGKFASAIPARWMEKRHGHIPSRLQTSQPACRVVIYALSRTGRIDSHDARILRLMMFAQRRELERRSSVPLCL